MRSERVEQIETYESDIKHDHAGPSPLRASGRLVCVIESGVWLVSTNDSPEPVAIDQSQAMKQMSRTPVRISGPRRDEPGFYRDTLGDGRVPGSHPRFAQADLLVKQRKPGRHFEVNELSGSEERSLVFLSILWAV